MSPALFVVLIVLCVAAALAALWPVLRRSRPRDGREAERETLLAALRENERDRDAGRIAPAEADAARAEIGRRVLRVDRALREAPPAERAGTAVPVLSALLVPLGAIALYAALGSPGTADRPLAARIAEASAPAVARAEAEAMVLAAEERLRENPDEAAGWLALAPVYRALGRDADARTALERALPELEGIPRARALVDLVDIDATEAGRIDERGAARLREALEIDPADGRAGFLFALHVEQTRPSAEAAETWRSLIAVHERTGAPWLDSARARLARLEGDAPPEDATAAAIRGMVEGLDDRLRAAPDDAEGWERLVQSRVVLGERDAARAALARARVAFADDRAVLDRFASLAERLGLEDGAAPRRSGATDAAGASANGAGGQTGASTRGGSSN